MKNKLSYLQKLLIGFTLLFTMFIRKDGIAQQDPVFNQYLNNLLTVQPAYAGMSGYVNVTALSRIQWVGFDGAPTTNTLTVSGPINQYNIGLGLSLINDKFGPVRQNALYVDYAFRILLQNNQYLSFGVKGGFNRYQAFLSDLSSHDPNDPLAIQDINQKYLPNFGFGFMWHSDEFFFGFSVPKFFKNKITSDSGESLYHEEVNYYAMGGYVFNLANDNLKFKPTFLYRQSGANPGIADFSGNFLFYDRIWVGGTYRLQNSYGLQFQVYIDSNKFLKIGYAYDLTTFHKSQSNSGTHEFMLSYDFPVIRRRACCLTPRHF